MATVAVYNLKGGVGKTTIAVNFAWAAATLGGMRTLLWDLDGQASATWILTGTDPEAVPGRDAKAVLSCEIPPQDVIVPTTTAGVDLLPADHSLHGLDVIFSEIDHKQHLGRLLDDLNDSYDLIVLDCPPGLGFTSSQVIRAASVVLLPMIPSTLSRRALEEVQTHLQRGGEEPPPIVPVFTMADMRRAAHRTAIETGPGYPVIPMASVIEMMADRNAPVGEYAPRSVAAQAFTDLWYAVEPYVREPV